MNYDEVDLDFEGGGSVHIDKLEDYLELLYSQDDFLKKVKGSFLIMQLSRSPDNLEFLVTNETLLNALGRELKEEGKKSMDLMINILYVFYSFSHFTQFHSIISNFKIGGIVMKTIAYEERRYEELTALGNLAYSSHKDLGQLKKIEKMLEKQERLLYVCFHILLNLAEDLNVEMKMKNRNIISLLVKCLERKSADLLMLCVMFLKKLSIFEENKIEMLSVPSLLPRLSNLLTQAHVPLKDNTMRLLFNLSFDPKVKEIMVVTPSFLVHCVEQLKDVQMFESTVKLLYNLSMSEKGRLLLGETPNMLLFVFEYVVNFPGTRVGKELIALAINLVQVSRNVDMMIGSPQNDTPPFNLQRLMERFIQTHDPMLGKMIRNISSHDRHKSSFLAYLPGLISMSTTQAVDETEIVVECLGILGNMNNLRGYSFIDCFKRLNVVEFILRHVQQLITIVREGHSSESMDLYLEVISLLGVVNCDTNCSRILATSPIIHVLSQLFLEVMYDDDFMVQILFAFYRFLQFEPTRKVFLQQKGVLLNDKRGLLSLLDHSNEDVVKLCDDICDLASDYDLDWKERTRRTKFYLHNQQWCKYSEQEDYSNQSNI